MLADPARRTLKSRSARRVCGAVKAYRSHVAVRGCPLLGLVAPRCSPPTARTNQQLPINRPPHERVKCRNVSAYWRLERRATPTQTTFSCPWQQTVRDQSVVIDIPCTRIGRSLALSTPFPLADPVIPLTVREEFSRRSLNILCCTYTVASRHRAISGANDYIRSASDCA